jgi:hypothetical protein
MFLIPLAERADPWPASHASKYSSADSTFSRRAIIVMLPKEGLNKSREVMWQCPTSRLIQERPLAFSLNAESAIGTR